MAIIAPSNIPRYSANKGMWTGIADIFGDISKMKEDKRQRERQEVLDAQNLAAHEQQMINAKLLGDKRQFELGQLQTDAANRLTPEQQAEHWGTITGPRLPSSWEGNVNIDPDRLEQGSSSSERDMSMVRLARDSKRDTILNLNTLNNAQINLQQEFRNGRIDEARYIKLNQDIEIAKQKEHDRNREADRLGREGQIKGSALEILSGRKTKPETIVEDLPSYSTFGDEYAGDIPTPRTVQRRFQKGDPEYDQAVLDYQLYGSPKAAQLKAVGVADAVTGKAIPDTMTKKQRQNSLAATMLAEIKTRSDYNENAFDEEEINRARDNILQAARQIAIASGDPSLDNQWKIAHVLSKTFNSGFKKGEMLDKPGFGFGLGGDYQDYTPMSTRDIVTAYNVPKKVTERYKQLEAEGKSKPEIERILRSEGLM